jgi:hypothetical protein
MTGLVRPLFQSPCNGHLFMRGMVKMTGQKWTGLGLVRGGAKVKPEKLESDPAQYGADEWDYKDHSPFDISAG